jgi:hypothetical protein
VNETTRPYNVNMQKKQSTDSESNLLTSERLDNIYYHKVLYQNRQMPCVRLLPDHTVVEIEEATEGELIKKFTLKDLMTYWSESITSINFQDNQGKFSWLVNKYNLSDILHGIDRLSKDLEDERDYLVRNQDPFNLKSYIEQVQEEREVVSRWS